MLHTLHIDGHKAITMLVELDTMSSVLDMHDVLFYPVTKTPKSVHMASVHNILLTSSDVFTRAGEYSANLITI